MDDPSRPSDPDFDDDESLTVPRASPLSAPPTPPATRPAGSVPPPPGGVSSFEVPGAAGLPASTAPSPFDQPAAGPPASPPGAPSPFGQPPSGAAAASPPAKPKSNGKRNAVIAGCGGCLFILLSICCCSGYLTYLEEGGSYDDPGEEAARVPIVSGQPIVAEHAFHGTGYAHVSVFVDVGEDAPPGTRVSGTIACTEYGTPRFESMDATSGGAGLPDGWVRTPGWSMYMRDGGSGRCTGTLTSSPPTSMELVFTERQRPSDWLSEWF